MSSNKDISVQDFLEFFPIVDLPITLNDDIVPEISKLNKVFPPEIIGAFFSKWDNDINETSEFLACCQLPPEKDFYSVVFWKASLLTYEFYLATLDKNGELIQKKVVAGLISNGSTIKRSVAKIEEDLSIHIMIGEQVADDSPYKPENSKGFYMEILPNGQLISSQDDSILWQEKNTN
jgi:hypothetical protein